MSIPTERELLVRAADNLLNAANGHEPLNSTLARRLGSAVINDKLFGVGEQERRLHYIQAHVGLLAGDNG